MSLMTEQGDSLRILITSIIDLKRSAPSRLHQIVRRLSRNHELTVVSPYDSWKMSMAETEVYAGNFPDAYGSLVQLHLPFRRLKPALQDFMSPFAVGNLKALVRETDVHFAYDSVVTGWLTTRIATHTGVPTILDVADDIPSMILESQQIPGLLRRPSSIVGALILNSTVKMANRVCCSSLSLSRRMEIPQEKARLIPNGVDTERFQELTAFEHLLHPGPRLIYVGVVREWVDIDSVMIAIRSLRKEYSDITLAVAGGETTEHQLAQLRTRYGGLMNYKGSRPYDEIPAIINEAAIGVIPFRRSMITEGAFPLKALEYAACSRPVVSSRVPELVRVFGDTFYFADSPNEIESCIRTIAENPEEARERADEAKRIVIENYRWDQIANQYEKELQSVVK